MKTFSLAGLLRVRSLEETLAAAGLADARRELGGVQAQRARTGAALAGTEADVVGTANLAAIAATRASAQARLAELALLEEAAGGAAAAAAAAHREARTAARAIERLRERADAELRREELRGEQAVLDEIAVTRPRRSGAAEGPAR